MEHALLGDTPPDQLEAVFSSVTDRNHALGEELRRMTFFQNDAGRDPRAEFPDIRWIKLIGSQLWVSYGEVNALADYLPDPSTIDRMPRRPTGSGTAARSGIEPVLQRVREQIANRIRRELRSGGPTQFAGAVRPGRVSGVVGQASEAAAEVMDIEAATGHVRSLDPSRCSCFDSYQTLLARNACHFVPFSWHRWAQFHNEARAKALRHHQQHGDTDPDAPEARALEGTGPLREAWLTNGYAEHFLQDSFAAGHLINKTLVMQWFLEYLNENLQNPGWLSHILPGGTIRAILARGLPDEEVRRLMTTTAQPGASGRELYGRAPSSSRAGGTDVTDPQSGQERTTESARIAGSAVRAFAGRSQRQAYQAYLRFLNNAFLNLGAGAVHNYFNAPGRGLTVRAPAATVDMHIGGDETMLAQGSREAGRLAGRAAHMAQGAIRELAHAGTTSITPEHVKENFPSTVVMNPTGPNRRELSLEEWHDQVLRDLCRTTIFPGLIRTFSESTGARVAQPQLSAEVSVDQPTAPQWSTLMSMNDSEIRAWVAGRSDPQIRSVAFEVRLSSPAGSSCR